MKRVKRKVLEQMIKRYPSDAELGAAIRSQFIKQDNHGKN